MVAPVADRAGVYSRDHERSGGRAVGCGGWCGVDDLNEGPSKPDSRLSVIYARAMAAYN
jgi:hypothetical protein